MPLHKIILILDFQFEAFKQKIILSYVVLVYLHFLCVFSNQLFKLPLPWCFHLMQSTNPLLGINQKCVEHM